MNLAYAASIFLVYLFLKAMLEVEQEKLQKSLEEGQKLHKQLLDYNDRNWDRKKKLLGLD